MTSVTAPQAGVRPAIDSDDEGSVEVKTAVQGNGTNGTASTYARSAEALRRLRAPSSTTPIPPHLAMAALRIAVTAAALGILAGTTAPGAWRLLKTLARAAIGAQDSRDYDSSSSGWSRPQLQCYLFAWSTFHFLEFAITARYNASRLYADSFLIQNGITYHVAHLCAILEFCVEARLAPRLKSVTFINVWLGLAILLIGQTARSLAMIHAAGNFSHEVAHRKRADHELVTDGIYRLSRHPSYFGFFYWAVGAQVLLGNPISFLVFVVVLWRFFAHRIRDEEKSLVNFFGDDYRQFRARTHCLIPFIR